MAAREGARPSAWDERSPDRPRVPMAISPEGGFLLYSFRTSHGRRYSTSGSCPLTARAPRPLSVRLAGQQLIGALFAGRKRVSYSPKSPASRRSTWPRFRRGARRSGCRRRRVVCRLAPLRRRLVWTGRAAPSLTATVEARGGDLVVGKPETLATASTSGWDRRGAGRDVRPHERRAFGNPASAPDVLDEPRCAERGQTRRPRNAAPIIGGPRTPKRSTRIFL